MSEKEKEIEQTEVNETETNVSEETTETVNSSETVEISNEERLEKELLEMKDKYLRLVAEFDNAKKRNAKERIELIQTAGKEVIVSMLDVLDDCDRAEKQIEGSDDVKIIKEGIALVFNKIRTTLNSKGLESFVSINEVFNVEKHEAITEIPSPNPKMKGKVIDEVQKGYNLNGVLVRYAKVVVGN